MSTDNGSSPAELLFPVLEAMGYRVVEITSRPVKGTLHVHIVIYKDDGVGVDDCAAVHRTALSRIEVLYGERDVHLEVSSPGIDRRLKSTREYSVFVGKGVTVYLRDGTQLGGVIRSAGSDSVTLLSNGREVTLFFNEIQKTKLDDSQEVG